jgi:hypothetical protein
VDVSISGQPTKVRESRGRRDDQETQRQESLGGGGEVRYSRELASSLLCHRRSDAAMVFGMLLVLL